MTEEEIIENEKIYQSWVHNSGLSPLTSTQVKFAKFLIENKVMVSKVGNMDDVFTSIRKFLKSK